MSKKRSTSWDPAPPGTEPPVERPKYMSRAHTRSGPEWKAHASRGPAMSALAYHGARSFESRPAEVWEAADEGWVLIASRGDRPDPSWLKEK